MGAAAAGQLDAKEGLKDAADFAMRHAGLFVEVNHGGLSIRTQLSRGSAERIGGLQGMPTLNAASACLAAADVNVELAMNGPTRNLDLVLLVDMRFLDIAAAVGTLVGQRCFVDFVDLFGRFAVSFGAVVLAGLATWLFRLGLGRSFGKGGGLTFAGTALLVEQAGQSLDLSTEFG